MKQTQAKVPRKSHRTGCHTPPSLPPRMGGKGRGTKQGIIFIAVAIFLFSFHVPSHATPPPEVIQSLTQKLERWDVEEIWPEVTGALAADPRDPELLELASEIAFDRGDYGESLRLMKSAIEAGGEDDKRRGFALFAEETINVLTPFKKFETPHFAILLDEKQDGILLDYLTDTLEKTYQVMASQYGFRPKEKVRVELFPDARSFYLASTLSVRDIEVTGAVGLTKFNKLQFLSPRALVYGYRWLDAISHEYMHYLIVKLTANKAPIWFHEGLAKYEETHWRSGPSYLSPLYQTLLAQAQTAGKLIPFEKMEPSLIHLDTPEEVQLAYAQAASAIEFLLVTRGHSTLREIMDHMARSTTAGAGEAIKETLELDFSAFETQWREFLASKDLKPLRGLAVHPFKVKEGQVDEERLDMEEIKSMVARNRTQLGDRLKERGRNAAAVLEFRRALAEAQDSVPIMTRLSSALLDLNRDEEAVEVLKQVQRLSPDHPTPYTRLGQIYLKRKDYTRAKAALEDSLQINPFDPEVHLELATTYEMLGEVSGAAREKVIAEKLIHK